MESERQLSVRALRALRVILYEKIGRSWDEISDPALVAEHVSLAELARQRNCGWRTLVEIRNWALGHGYEVRQHTSRPPRQYVANEQLSTEIKPTEQEKHMISILREWGGTDHYRMVIKFSDGAWEIAIAAPSYEMLESRGVGATFDTAGDAMAPTRA
jgi:hypothetical protein